ncbi:SDR family NAD(P)-dependent oxidoreductase [Luteibacter aegosomatissinici]|uniref:SDR family NAD(P)-dependent oxidoreductase n=1 Tax=Luteibacter aegosomatissinici TaxID=2911539 RepID=UPI001FFB0FA7|nr:SDR family oxidoreductase [Luteibacter aegosomatissinici]UPG92726.1 SDR family oxidoreductase [Luteibacter aegosomatissinici]
MTNQPRWALITGASSGIGEAYAERLAESGYNLVIVARRTDRLNAVAERLAGSFGVEVEVIAADLARTEDVRRIAARLEAGPRIEIFINNAGYAFRGKVTAFDADLLDKMLAVNVQAMTRLARSAMGQMVQAGSGIIINVSSATAFLLRPGNAGYGASKSYVMAFSRHMQLEAAGTGVYVQLLVPGIIATDFHQIAGADLARYPADRIMSAADLVTASLSAVDLREDVCIPSLPDAEAWSRFLAAEGAIAADVSHDKIASRYLVAAVSSSGSEVG